MINDQERQFLHGLLVDYARAISDALASLGTVYDALAELEEEPTRWLATAELLAVAQAQGESLALLNRFIDYHRNDWMLLGGFDPLAAYELGGALAESLIVCHLARTPQGAIALPLITVERLEQLYTPLLQQWVARTLADGLSTTAARTGEGQHPYGPVSGGPSSEPSLRPIRPEHLSPDRPDEWGAPPPPTPPWG